MVNRPNEKDQINMIITNLLPAYNNKLLSSPINSFAELCDCGTRIEDAINTRRLDLSEAKLQAKKVNVVFARPQKWVFNNLQMPLSKVLVVLTEGGTSSHLILLLFQIQSRQIGIEIIIVTSTKG